MNNVLPDFPLVLASSACFARINQAFRRAGFEEATLCQELRIPSLSDLGKVRWAQLPYDRQPARLRDWAGVFLFGQHGSRAALETVFGEIVLADLFQCGLLRELMSSPGTVVSPVFLYPCAGCLVASDRHDDPERPGVLRDAQPDVVFPGIFGGTLRFLELLPTRPGGDALDLCGGCGIGALVLGRHARTAVSADITSRATLFAEFNARLNLSDGVEALCGDVFEPVQGRLFDVITAHPPYVPSLGSTMIYRDAGDAGEDITRRIVTGLPAHLRPGGRAFILCQGRDADDGLFEERARQWLGAEQSGFDVLFALQTTKTLEQEVTEMARRANPPTPTELDGLIDRFRRLGTRQFVYGALLLARHPAVGSPPVTTRTRLARETASEDFERLLTWQHLRLRPDFEPWLAQTPLRLSPFLELRIRHVVENGQLVPAEFIFEAERPFASVMRIDGWVTPLVARLDGATAPATICAEAARAGDLPPGFGLADFVQLLAKLVERGYLSFPNDRQLSP